MILLTYFENSLKYKEFIENPNIVDSVYNSNYIDIKECLTSFHCS